MVQLKHKDVRVIDDAFDMQGGYVLNFSDRTFAEFFDDEFHIDIDKGKYQTNGTSKAKRLRTFFAVEDAYTVAKVLRGLWEHKESLPDLEYALIDGTIVQAHQKASGAKGGHGIKPLDALAAG